MPWTVCSRVYSNFALFFFISGHISNTDLGPVITPESKKRICSIVESGVKEGAKLILDGRSVVVPGFEKGNFVGPTILADVKVIIVGVLLFFILGLHLRVWLISFWFVHEFVLSTNLIF